MSKSNPITINPDTGEQESEFRGQVRDVLNLSWDTRDEAILAELRRLKKSDEIMRSVA